MPTAGSWCNVRSQMRTQMFPMMGTEKLKNKKPQPGSPPEESSSRHRSRTRPWNTSPSCHQNTPQKSWKVGALSQDGCLPPVQHRRPRYASVAETMVRRRVKKMKRILVPSRSLSAFQRSSGDQRLRCRHENGQKKKRPFSPQKLRSKGFHPNPDVGSLLREAGSSRWKMRGKTMMLGTYETTSMTSTDAGGVGCTESHRLGRISESRCRVGKTKS